MIIVSQLSLHAAPDTLCKYIMAPRRTLLGKQVALPATIGVFALDRIVLRGALFESIARAVNPAYKTKIIKHEAGQR
jgi:hypothetical protein